MVTKYKLIVIIVITALISFSLGLLTTSLIASNQIKANQQKFFQAGWQAAKERLNDSGYYPQVNMEIKNLSGEIKSISDNKISLKIHPLEPLANPDLDNRLVVVDNNTKIYKLGAKSQVEYQKEVTEFNKQIQGINNNSTKPESLTPPQYFNKIPASSTELKVGQMITVLANQDIKNLKEFTAVEISLQSILMPTIPAPGKATTTANSPVKP